VIRGLPFQQGIQILDWGGVNLYNQPLMLAGPRQLIERPRRALI
jgi:hypothetical protein